MKPAPRHPQHGPRASLGRPNRPSSELNDEARTPMTKPRRGPLHDFGLCHSLLGGTLGDRHSQPFALAPRLPDAHYNPSYPPPKPLVYTSYFKYEGYTRGILGDYGGSWIVWRGHCGNHRAQQLRPGARKHSVEGLALYSVTGAFILNEDWRDPATLGLEAARRL